MSIKSMVKVYDEIRKETIEQAMSDEGIDRTNILVSEFSNNAESARKIILSVLPEKEFVKYMNLVQKTIVAIEQIDGKSKVVAADVAGELYGYTHSVVLAVIGGLIEDEIL